MKNYNLLIVLLVFTVLSIHAQDQTPATEAGEDFDLSAVMYVMETAEDIEDLEKKINLSDHQINNLDLNKDNEIDIVKIVEFDDDNIRVLALRAVIGEHDYQDIATIEIEKHSDTEISLQIIGDPDLYGPDYILEPASDDSLSSGQGGGQSIHEHTELMEVLNAAVFVSVHRWRPIRPLFVVGRVAFVSAVVWRPIPAWFVIRRPIARSTWRSRSRRYRNNRYRTSRTRHSRNASRVYSNNRKKSANAKKNVGPKPGATSKNTATQSKKTTAASNKTSTTNKKSNTKSSTHQQKNRSSSPPAKSSASKNKKTGHIKR